MSQHRYYRHQDCRNVDRFTGVYVYRPDPQKIRMVNASPDDAIRIGVENGYRRQIVSSSLDYLECDLNTQGPGGIHPSYAFNLAAHGVYTIYSAWRSNTAEHDGVVCLFGVPTGTTITPAIIAALDPIGSRWDYWSTKPVAVWVNKAGFGARDFIYSDGLYQLMDITTAGVYVLNAGAAVVKTSINIDYVVPVEARSVVLWITAANVQDTVRTVTMYRNDGTSVPFWTASLSDGNPNRYHKATGDNFPCGMVGSPPNLATMLQYLWDGAPAAGGMYVAVSGFYLF